VVSPFQHSCAVLGGHGTALFRATYHIMCLTGVPTSRYPAHYCLSTSVLNQHTYPHWDHYLTYLPQPFRSLDRLPLWCLSGMVGRAILLVHAGLMLYLMPDCLRGAPRTCWFLRRRICPLPCPCHLPPLYWRHGPTDVHLVHLAFSLPNSPFSDA